MKKNNGDDMEKYNSRKFLLGAVIFIVGTTIFVLTSKLSGDNWVELVKWVGGTYFVTNAISKIINKGS